MMGLAEGIHYNEDLRDSIQDQPEAMVTLGLLIHAKELGLPVSAFDDSTGSSSKKLHANNKLILSFLLPSIDQSMIDWGSCLTQAISGILGWRNAKAVYNQLLTMGLNVNTALGALKVIAKRAAFGITAGIAIYEFIGCMGYFE